MKDTELRRERDSDLYCYYVQGLRSQHFKNMHEAADWCRNQPAPQFYISPKSLVNYLGILMRGGSIDDLHPYTKEKVLFLEKMYYDFIAENPGHGLSRERVCEILVEMPAPKFYIGHDRALQILQQKRADTIKEQVARWNR